MDGGAWWATVQGVSKSQIWLSEHVPALSHWYSDGLIFDRWEPIQTALGSFWHIPIVLWALPCLQAQDSGSSCTFPAPSLASAISPRSSFFLYYYYRKTVFRKQDTRYVHWYCSVTALRTSQRTKLRNTYKILCIYIYYTFTPYTTFTFISTLNIYILRFNFSFFLFSFFFLLHCMAYEILAPRPGIELRPIPLEAQSFNHWTTRKVLQIF